MGALLNKYFITKFYFLPMQMREHPAHMRLLPQKWKLPVEVQAGPLLFLPITKETHALYLTKNTTLIDFKKSQETGDEEVENSQEWENIQE